MTLEDKISRLPKKPGVYQFKDSNGKILYIGKAKNLRSRVSSYFLKHGGHSGRTRVMLRKISDLSVIVVESEFDALLLENSLIKKYQPRYNVMLKDDKTYPWLCIKKERFPRVFPTRNKIDDGSVYFGPYASVKTMKTLLNLIRRVYKIRTCKYNLSEENISAGKFKVCLEYHIGNCLGPCEGFQSEEDYNRQIEEIIQIIKGDISGLTKHLRSRMSDYAERLEYEMAQKIKDRIAILENYRSKSTVVNPNLTNIDVFGLVSDINYSFVNYLKVVDGAIIHSQTLTYRKKLDESEAEIIALAIAEIKNETALFGENLLVSHSPAMDLPSLEISIPQRGDKKKLLDLSLRNAKYVMLDKHRQDKHIDPEQHSERLLLQVQKDLRLKALPKHIECFDNSNFHGTNAVSACVVFKNGKPSKKDYRHYNIKTVIGPDDFASMKEVVFRRYKRLLDEGLDLPQLIVIDGGKGQLNAAKESLITLELHGKIAILGIAKKLEELYFPGDSVPLHLDRKSETLRLLQHLRNEAHRFGIKHHRNIRSKNAIKTELTDIPGIGKQTAEKLLRKFGSLAKLKIAPLDELVREIGSKKAKVVREWFELES